VNKKYLTVIVPPTERVEMKKSGKLTIHFMGRKTDSLVFDEVSPENYKWVNEQIANRVAFLEVVHSKGTARISNARRISSIDYTGSDR